MNLILIDHAEVTDNLVTLADHRSKHIIKILKSRQGDSLRVGVINGRKGTGTVKKISKKKVTLDLNINGKLPNRPPTDLILALPRPIMLKRVLAQAAALGVGQIFLINANRVEKSFFSASLLVEENYRQFLLGGLEQSMDTILPKIHIFKRFKPFVEDTLPKLLSDYSHKLLAHPTAIKDIWQQAPPPVQGQAILAIGPEGGWVDYEINKFQEHEFTPFSLGPRILRVDSAVPAILSQFDLLRKMTNK